RAAPPALKPDTSRRATALTASPDAPHRLQCAPPHAAPNATPTRHRAPSPNNAAAPGTAARLNRHRTPRGNETAAVQATPTPPGSPIPGALAPASTKHHQPPPRSPSTPPDQRPQAHQQGRQQPHEHA